jgi:hypothetical protein
MSFLFNVGGLIKVEVPFEVLCFDANGMSTFQARVTIQICDLHVLFLIMIHCKTRKTNLAIRILFGLPMVTHLENLL